MPEDKRKSAAGFEIRPESPLGELVRRFRRLGAKTLFVKKLAPNDNSKNQVYLAGDLSVVNKLPIDTITDSTRGKKGVQYKASLNFFWLTDSDELEKARGAQLILYPQYPEVRLSGFLTGCKAAPNDVMTVRDPGRCLFLGVTEDRRILAFASPADAAVSRQVTELDTGEASSVLVEIPLEPGRDNEELLLHELHRVFRLDWIQSKRLNAAMEVVECNTSQCVGYTLEAELGIPPNAHAAPDFHGWEVKAYTVRNAAAPTATVITLMTPEPDSGVYVDAGVEAFVRKYGYADKRGRADRLNFGSRHWVGRTNETTGLTLVLAGFNPRLGKIVDENGGIALLDADGNVAAMWSFAKLIEHWNRKHERAVYVPAQKHKELPQRYRYGATVGLGNGTSFEWVLRALGDCQLFYDPGIKLVGASTSKPESKRRSQFRIRSTDLPSLYSSYRLVDVRRSRNSES